MSDPISIPTVLEMRGALSGCRPSTWRVVDAMREYGRGRYGPDGARLVWTDDEASLRRAAHVAPRTLARALAELGRAGIRAGIYGAPFAIRWALPSCAQFGRLDDGDHHHHSSRRGDPPTWARVRAHEPRLQAMLPEGKRDRDRQHQHGPDCAQRLAYLREHGVPDADRWEWLYGAERVDAALRYYAGAPDESRGKIVNPGGYLRWLVRQDEIPQWRDIDSFEERKRQYAG